MPNCHKLQDDILEHSLDAASERQQNLLPLVLLVLVKLVGELIKENTVLINDVHLHTDNKGYNCENRRESEKNDLLLEAHYLIIISYSVESILGGRK